MNLTCTGTLYEDEYYHVIVKPFSPEDNNVLDITVKDIKGHDVWMVTAKANIAVRERRLRRPSALVAPL